MNPSSQHLENSGPSDAAGLALPLSLVLDVLAIMKEAYKPFPKELWGLSRSTDLLAPRGFVIDEDDPLCRYYLRAGSEKRYPIVGLRTVDSFNRPIGIFPGVTRVIFGREFDCPVGLPFGVTEIAFGEEMFYSDSKFNQRLMLPEGLKKVYLARYFNQPIILPESLTHIRFGKRFNQTISLPPSLAELDFDADGVFNHLLVLPASLRRLSMNRRFNHPITLPSKLESASFCCDFNQELALPDGLKDLSFENSAVRYPLSLPDSVEDLMLACNCLITRMSKGLKSVFVGIIFAHPIEFPDSLEDLTWHPNRRVDLPKGLKKAEFGPRFRQPVLLPPNLESVTFQGVYNHPLLVPHGCERIDREEDSDESDSESGGSVSA